VAKAQLNWAILRELRLRPRKEERQSSRLRRPPLGGEISVVRGAVVRSRGKKAAAAAHFKRPGHWDS